MNSVFETLLQNGILGLFAGALLHFYLRERKVNQSYAERSLEIQVADAAAKNKLAHGLGDLVQSMDAMDASIIELTKSTRDLEKDFEVFVAKEQGRREAEVTGRIIMQKGTPGDDSK